MNKKIQLENIDLELFLPKLSEESVDLIVLDPPYYKVVKEKWDNQWETLSDYLIWFENILQELYRISKYSTSCWLFGFPKQLTYLIPMFEKYGFCFKQMICIDKGLRSVAGRTSSKLKMFPTASEYIVFFYKDAKSIVKQMLISRKEECKLSAKELNTHLGRAVSGGGTWSSIAGVRKKNTEYPTQEVWDNLNQVFKTPLPNYNDYIYKFNQETGLTDIWNDINFYDKTFDKIHPTQKPYKLIERLIKCSSNEEDVVLDIFSGSGMTARVCKDLKRRFKGCEKNKLYYTKSLDFIEK
jgi:DNA modification methylase